MILSWAQDLYKKPRQNAKRQTPNAQRPTLNAQRETRRQAYYNLKNPDNWVTNLYKKSSSGVNVSADTSLGLSAMWACIRILSETMGVLPFHVYERKTNGDKQIATGHPIDFLLSSEPHPWYSSFTFRETMQMHLCLYGNAFARIHRAKGNVKHFEILDPSTVEIWVNEKGLQWYKVLGIPDKLFPDEMIHIPALAFDGLMGKAPITAHKDAIGLGLTLQDNANEFFKNGALLSGVLEVPGALRDDAYERLKASWATTYSGTGDRHKTAILEDGTKFTANSIPPEQAQFIESRKFQVTEIARIFRIPPHMIADLERATFSNIEHQGIDFVTHTMMPWLTRWETEFNRKLFGKESPYYTKFNANALLRGDHESRAKFYTSMFNIGAMSQNDIRGLEDLNKIPDGDRYFVPLNMVPADKVDQQLENKKPQPEAPATKDTNDGKDE